MERKGFVVGAIVIVLAVIGLAIWANRDDARPGALEPVEGGASEEGARAASAGEAREPEEAPRAAADRRRPAPVLDGGVARVAAPPTSPPASPGIEPQRAEMEASRSAGWRLGRTRARIALIEPRIARLREMVEQFEQRGDAEGAERQRRVLTRFENRLAELRTEERDFEAQAQRDGTLGEAQQGYEEEQSNVVVRRPIPANAPAAAPR